METGWKYIAKLIDNYCNVTWHSIMQYYDSQFFSCKLCLSCGCGQKPGAVQIIIIGMAICLLNPETQSFTTRSKPSLRYLSQGPSPLHPPHIHWSHYCEHKWKRGRLRNKATAMVMSVSRWDKPEWAAYHWSHALSWHTVMCKFLVHKLHFNFCVLTCNSQLLKSWK